MRTAQQAAPRHITGPLRGRMNQLAHEVAGEFEVRLRAAWTAHLNKGLNDGEDIAVLMTEVERLAEVALAKGLQT